jgi:hypothetical protein
MKNIANPLTTGEEILIRGVVVNINFEPMTWCGNGILTILTTEHSELKLHIIGGRRPQCPRATVKKGDSIQACGTVIEEDTIALTNPEQHYLRLESDNNPNTGSIATIE